MPSLKKYKMCKKYDLDIWGDLGRSKAPTKTLHYIFLRYKLNYSIWSKIKSKSFLLSKDSQKFMIKFSRPREKPIKLKKRTNKTKANRLRMEQIVRLHYGIQNKKSFRHIRKRRKSKFFFSSVIVELEMRLENIIRRLQLINSMFVIRKFIREGFFFIDGKQIFNPFHTVNLFSIITIDKHFLEKKILPAYKSKLSKKNLKCSTPTHLFINMSKGIIIVIDHPKSEELVWTFANNQDVIITC